MQPNIITPEKCTTSETATMLRTTPQTIRSGLCRNGHYLGLKPVKLPNGKLLWDSTAIQRLVSGEVR